MPILAPLSGPDFATAIRLLIELPGLMEDARVRLELSLLVQAKQVGVSHGTLTRLQSGSVPTRSTILACLRWLAALAPTS